jgi:hypothetical protein
MATLSKVSPKYSMGLCSSMSNDGSISLPTFRVLSVSSPEVIRLMFSCSRKIEPNIPFGILILPFLLEIGLEKT